MLGLFFCLLVHHHQEGVHHHASRYYDFGFVTSIYLKCHLIGQMDKEFKNLSNGKENGKASQSCKK